mmetsp:Transcript_177/g.186  ORF Transcript_177/g.186 Transcript_177/m.186 type:complete len:251 (+) Transcript_177:121-873(+)
MLTIKVITLSALCLTQHSIALASPPKLELKYFDARGAAETSRLLLTLAGAEYKDTRYTITPGTMAAPAFLAAKESNELDMNLSRAPVLVVDDEVTIGQSRTIERFLARTLGLMGDSEVEASLVDCITEHCRDVKDAQMKKGFSFFTRDKTEEEKATAREEWFSEDMPTMLGKIEKVLQQTSGATGYAVGKQTSYADAVIFSLLGDGMGADDNTSSLKAAEKCEQLTAIVNRISTDERVSKWLQNRPVTKF